MCVVVNCNNKPYPTGAARDKTAHRDYGYVGKIDARNITEMRRPITRLGRDAKAYPLEKTSAFCSRFSRCDVLSKVCKSSWSSCGTWNSVQDNADEKQEKKNNCSNQ